VVPAWGWGWRGRGFGRLPGEEAEYGRGGERAECGADARDGGEEEQLPRPLLHVSGAAA
jgi:hypothetical protein